MEIVLCAALFFTWIICFFSSMTIAEIEWPAGRSVSAKVLFVVGAFFTFIMGPLSLMSFVDDLADERWTKKALEDGRIHRCGECKRIVWHPKEENED